MSWGVGLLIAAIVLALVAGITAALALARAGARELPEPERRLRPVGNVDVLGDDGGPP